MKKIIIAILALAVLATGVMFAIGQRSGDSDKRFGGKRGGHHRGARIALRGVGLTDEQKAKMKEIRQASRETIKPLREALKANREKMRTLSENGSFDEVAVTALANEQAAISAKLIVERQRVISQTFALLTDEQKAKLAEAKAKRTERRQARKAAKAEKVGE